jgi:hypothetical protein
VVSVSWLVVGAFVGGVVVLTRRLRQHDEEGSFDLPTSSVARPGLRRFFDYGPSGWSEDGVDQRPVGRT